MYTKLGFCLFFTCLILSCGCTKSCSQEPYQEAYQESYQAPYTEIETTQIPLQYDCTYTWRGTGILDWEIDYSLTCHNVDTVGGTFGTYVEFYDGGRLVYTTPLQRDYIGPGGSKTFEWVTQGLSYSTDWDTRYTFKLQMTQRPTKTVQTPVTRYRTEYRTAYRTAYREVCN
jgi:hypothetical protein